MKNEDFKNLEDIYESVTNKEKVLVTEDANETLGAALVYAVAFGLPAVWEILKRMYPELKNKYDQTIQKNAALAEKIKSIIKQSKQEPRQEPKQDDLAGMLSGGVRKKQPRI
jgi:ribulose kinase